MRDQNLRLLPDVKEGGDWSSDGRRCSSVEDVHVDLLQSGNRGGVREVRRDGGGRLEGVREYGGHRRWRISPRMSAGTAESGDRFRQPWGTIRRGKGGEMKRSLRATYSRGDASIGVG
jgi:hypothetical protein